MSCCFTPSLVPTSKAAQRETNALTYGTLRAAFHNDSAEERVFSESGNHIVTHCRGAPPPHLGASGPITSPATSGPVPSHCARSSPAHPSPGLDTIETPAAAMRLLCRHGLSTVALSMEPTLRPH